MAIITYLQTWAFVNNGYDEDARVYWNDYEAERWDFDTVTRQTTYYPQPEGGRYRENMGFTPAPEDIRLYEVFAECLPGTTTRRSYQHDQQGGIVNFDKLDSAECGYEPDPDPDPDLDPDPDPDPEPEPEPEPEPDPEPDPIYLTAELPATLAAVHLPVLVTLHSAATGKTAGRAELLITLGSVAGGTVLTVNGERFVASFTPGANEFDSAETLAQVLASSLALSSRYQISQPSDKTVKLVAYAPGSAFTPVAASSRATITLAVTAGVDALRSQTKTSWGCFVEVWVVEGARYGSDVEPSQARYVDRLEQFYQPSNAYVFDLAATLREFVAHDRQRTDDRLIAYLVRYGEVYVPAELSASGEAPMTLRRRFTLAQSPVCWAVESAVPLADTTTQGLSSLPPSWRLPAGRPFYAEQLTVLAPQGETITVSCAARRYDGQLQTTSISLAAEGGVQAVSLSAMLAALPATVLTALFTLQVGAVTYVQQRLTRYEPGRDAVCLVLLSRRGCYESFWLRGTAEPNPKASAALYARGRLQAVRRVELTPSRKLSAGRLDEATFAWLSVELAGSPQVYLFEPTTGDYTDVIVSGFNADADPSSNTYSVAVDVVPAAPTAVIPA